MLPKNDKTKSNLDPFQTSPVVFIALLPLFLCKTNRGMLPPRLVAALSQQANIKQIWKMEAGSVPVLFCKKQKPSQSLTIKVFI